MQINNSNLSFGKIYKMPWGKKEYDTYENAHKMYTLEQEVKQKLREIYPKSRMKVSYDDYLNLKVKDGNFALLYVLDGHDQYMKDGQKVIKKHLNSALPITKDTTADQIMMCELTGIPPKEQI